MSGRPGWLDGIPGFDPERWWVPVVCTHRVKDLPLIEGDLIGVVFDDGSDELRWQLDPMVSISLTRGINRGPIDIARFARIGDLTRRRGNPGQSVSIACPDPRCSRVLRRTSEQWQQIFENARQAEAPAIDVSLHR